MGVVVGSLSTLGADRFVRNLLYGVPATDRTSLYFAAGILFLIAVAATFLPASRAMDIDPAEALRSEY
jgi:ABC-type lipoprotein release transport system permease subunit